MARLSRDECIIRLGAQKVLPLFTCTDTAVGMRVLEALHGAGVRLVEFTNRSPAAPAVFAELVRWAADTLPDLLLGAGTIIDVPQAEAFAAAGAEFLVAPHLDEDLGRWCGERGLAWCPGTAAVTEMVRAHRLGAAVIKVFPADTLGGPAFIKAVRGPAPWLRLMPSGGVTTDPANLSAWFAAGAHCVGIGSQLIDPARLASGDFDELRTRARSLMALLPEA